MKSYAMAAFLLATVSGSAMAAPPTTMPSNYRSAYVHPKVMYYQPQPTLQPVPSFRWGWFGAQTYPSPPMMQRDYTGGYRQWSHVR